MRFAWPARGKAGTGATGRCGILPEGRAEAQINLLMVASNKSAGNGNASFPARSRALQPMREKP